MSARLANYSSLSGFEKTTESYEYYNYEGENPEVHFLSKSYDEDGNLIAYSLGGNDGLYHYAGGKYAVYIKSDFVNSEVEYYIQ